MGMGSPPRAQSRRGSGQKILDFFSPGSAAVRERLKTKPQATLPIVEVRLSPVVVKPLEDGGAPRLYTMHPAWLRCFSSAAAFPPNARASRDAVSSASDRVPSSNRQSACSSALRRMHSW